jgi:predicted GH43/DUF377 family glycosyl hydrolase
MNANRNHKYLFWKRYEKNPVIPVVTQTWKHAWTANPDIILIGNTYFLYYRGQGTDGKDRIGVMTVKEDDFDGRTFDDYGKNPIIDTGHSGAFDSQYVLDPAVVKVDGKIFMYYSGISSTRQEGNVPDSIGLAVSDDGYSFNKYEKNPLFPGRAPEIVHKDGKFHMLYQKNESLGYFINQEFSIYLALSEDGYHFEDYSKDPVFELGKPDEWDAHIVTPRVFYEDGIYLMIFAGDPHHYDYSRYFGLAASKDLINWRKYPGNPIYSRGESGAWDEGGIWFPTFIKVKDTYYMWYEGYGNGKDRDKAFDTPGFSQIGLATLTGIDLKDLFANI